MLLTSAFVLSWVSSVRQCSLTCKIRAGKGSDSVGILASCVVVVMGDSQQGRRGAGPKGIAVSSPGWGMKPL